jgi:hypothetical protein
MQGPIIGRLSLPAASASQAVVLAFDSGLVANTDYLLKLIAVDAYSNCQVSSRLHALGQQVSDCLAALPLVLHRLLPVGHSIYSLLNCRDFIASAHPALNCSWHSRIC